MELRHRVCGGLLGLVAVDSLGTTLEFSPTRSHAANPAVGGVSRIPESAKI